MRWSAPGWRSTVAQVLVTAALGAAVPRVARWLRWPAGAGRRGLAVYVAVNVVLGFWLRERLRRSREEYEQVVADARARAGREPTQRDVHDEYARRMLRRSLGHEPTDEELERALRPGGAA
jgi:hypothetical protein